MALSLAVASGLSEHESDIAFLAVVSRYRECGKERTDIDLS